MAIAKRWLTNWFINMHKRSKIYLTTLFTQNEQTQKYRVSMSFFPQITNKLKTKMAEHQLEIVYKSEKKIANLLGSTKDKTPTNQKSGVYSIECEICHRKYYGQTKRSIETRFKDHCACIRLNQPTKSAVASHVLLDGHEDININNLCLAKQVNDNRRLDA